jgi:pimeloyl-ACP methyl ester carboxylesterase
MTQSIQLPSQASGGALVSSWRERGREIEIFQRRLFCIDVGPRDADPILVLHGFPSSSLDFHRVIDRLAESHRVVLHDHLGFGLSDKPRRYSYSLVEQAEHAVALWRRLGITSGHLVTHDYGTSVATEILARRERGSLGFEPRSLTLCNGSVLIELAGLRLSQHIARSPLLGPAFGRLVFAAYFKRVMRRLWGDPSRVAEADLDAMWQGIVYRDGRLRVHQLSSYLDERYRYRERWVGALRRLDLPTLVLWARRDPVAVPAIAEGLAQRIPDSRIEWLDELGHYPMLEGPDRWSRALLHFLRTHSGEAARHPPTGASYL